ncbi:MAG: adenylate/guanylate cyclase domain-containing protein [Mariprofundales bacterium]
MLPYNPNAHIVMVDDMPDQLLMLKMMLRASGFGNFKTFNRAAKLIAYLESGVEVDLILSDIMMPEIDGVESCKRIHADPRFSHIPIIMVSSMSDASHLNAAFDAGAVDYIRKPVDRTELRARVRSVLRLRAEMQRRMDREKDLSLLLRRVLPARFAAELEDTGRVAPKTFESVTVIFADFQSFTSNSALMQPQALISTLNTLFDAFDFTVEHYRLSRIKTVGDEYQAVAGIPDPHPQHALLATAAVLDLWDLLEQWRNFRREHGLIHWGTRFGLNCGPCNAGVVGNHRFQFDLWGSTINKTSRVTSACKDADIFVSSAVASELEDYVHLEAKGEFPIKGLEKDDLFAVRGLKDGVGEKYLFELLPEHRHWVDVQRPALLKTLLINTDEAHDIHWQTFSARDADEVES